MYMGTLLSGLYPWIAFSPFPPMLPFPLPLPLPLHFILHDLQRFAPVEQIPA